MPKSRHLDMAINVLFAGSVTVTSVFFFLYQIFFFFLNLDPLLEIKHLSEYSSLLTECQKDRIRQGLRKTVECTRVRVLGRTYIFSRQPY